MTPDTMAPTVALTAPVANSRLVGVTTLSASVTDNVGVTKVDFASVTNGDHVLTAKASDAAGNSTTSDGVPVVVGALPTDQMALVVSIAATSAGETGLQVAVVVAASDDIGMVSPGPHTLVAIAADASGKSTRSTAAAFTAKEGTVVVNPDGGTTAGPGPGTTTEPDGVRGGCSCDGTSAGPMALGLMMLGLLRRRRVFQSAPISS